MGGKPLHVLAIRNRMFHLHLNADLVAEEGL